MGAEKRRHSLPPARALRAVRRFDADPGRAAQGHGHHPGPAQADHAARRVRRDRERAGARALADHREPAPAAAHRGDGRRDRRRRPLARASSPTAGRREIGRLGGALNAMLGQIEDAFAERSASEARLRRFISDASHELRTPVAAVSAYAELFDRGARDRPDDLERSMTGIQRETRRMGLLVSDLLLLARLDQGRPLEARPRRSDGARRRGGRCRACDGARPAARARGAAPRHGHGRCGAPPPGDRQPARERARAHTPATAAADRARAARRARRGARGRRTAAPGMDAERGRARLRALLSAAIPRARATTAARASGSRSWPRSCEAHGGSVAVESMPGAGTTFRMTLPDRAPSTALPLGSPSRSSLPARPALCDLAVCDPEDHDRRELDRLTVGGWPSIGPVLVPRSVQRVDDPIALGDQVVDREAEVRVRAVHRGHHVLGALDRRPAGRAADRDRGSPGPRARASRPGPLRESRPRRRRRTSALLASSVMPHRFSVVRTRSRGRARTAATSRGGRPVSDSTVPVTCSAAPLRACAKIATICSRAEGRQARPAISASRGVRVGDAMNSTSRAVAAESSAATWP